MVNGQKLSKEVLKGEKAEYGKYVVDEIGSRLQSEYGKGFDRTSIYRMIKFYQRFPDFQIVATCRNN